jgi:hypothetical protein
MMSNWTIETMGTQSVLTHHCEAVRPNDSSDLLSQDIGGGYVRCARCGEKYLPDRVAGNPRLLLRLNRPETSGPVPMHG